MSCDRFILFSKDQVVPSKDDVGKALEDYLGDFMTSIEWGGGRWTALLVGHKSWPFRRLESDSHLAAAFAEESKEERWIEVFIDDDNIDVITRRQDEVVNNIADGFANLVARYWDGNMETT